MYVYLLQESQYRLYVQTGGGEQRLAERLAAQAFAGAGQIRVLDVQRVANQGESVGMYAAGGQGDDRITGVYAVFVDHLGAIHDTHCEAGQIVLILGHQTGMLGGLAADQGTAGLHTALGNAGNDGGDLLGLVLAAGNVVEKEQRTGAGADDVVHAHSHAVDTHGVVLVHHKGQLDLGADAVGAADQNGILHAGQRRNEHTAESADVIDRAFVLGALDMCLHQFNGTVTGGNIHAGGFVAFAFTSHIGDPFVNRVVYVGDYSLPFQQ